MNRQIRRNAPQFGQLGHLVRVDYAEPCADLVPAKVKKFRPGA